MNTTNEIALTYNLPVITRGNVRIEWVNLGEGREGDYDPTNECDENYLRFDVSRLNGKNWEPIDDGSYCTLVASSTPRGELVKKLEKFMREIHDDVAAQKGCKRILEKLSHTE